MKPRLHNTLLLITGLMTGVFVSIGHGVFAEREAARATLPVDELRTFSDVFGRIKNDYVVDVDDKELIENAIRGMLSGLDPHSAYLDSEQFTELQVEHQAVEAALVFFLHFVDGVDEVVRTLRLEL